MKKLLFIVVALVLAGGAVAQDVEKLAEKYSGKDGVTVIRMEGDMLKGLGGISGIVNDVNISEAIKNVKNVTVIVNEKGDAELRKDIKVVVGGKEYTPMMNVSSSGDNIRIVKADAKRGKDGELIITIDEGDGKDVLVKIVGDFDANTFVKVDK